MAKKPETWSFIEQPRLFSDGVIHREFVAGKKSDYVIELGSSEALRHRCEPPQEIMAAVHLPLGALGHQVFERMETSDPEPADNKIVQGLMHVGIIDGQLTYGPAYLHSKDDRTIGAVRVQGRKLWAVKVSKPIREEVFALVRERLAAYDNGTLRLPEEPLIGVPTRPGKMWMWSARWRELHADPKGMPRPSGLSRAGNRWITGISSVRLETVSR